MNTIETSMEPHVDRRLSDFEATILSFPPQEIEEVLDSGIDQERNHVVKTRVLDIEKTRHGAVVTEIFKMDNGRQYEVVTGQPVNQQVDLALVKTTALATSIRGHNMHNMLQAMKLGYPVVMVGPEGGHAHLPKTPRSIRRTVKNLMNISLEESAENMHEILNVTDTYDFYQPGNFVTTGESRGTMVGMGVVARAAKFGRLAIYSDFTAGCFPKSRAEIGASNNLALETVKQTSLFGELPLKMSPKRYIHYPATLNLNPYFIAHVIGTIPALLDGSAGKLAREIPRDSQMHHTLFNEDSWSCPDGWDEIFADYAGVVNTRRPGNHMAITNELTARERAIRLSGLRDELKSTQNQPERIDWNNVHLAGRVALRAV